MSLELSDTGDVEPVANKSGKARSGVSEQKTPLGINAELLNDVDVSITAVLGQGHLSVSQLFDLSLGEILNLDTPLNGTVDLMLNDRVVARGEIVAVDDRFGVRITQLMTGVK